MVAIVTTGTFVASTVFAFGATTHRSQFLTWGTSGSGYGLVEFVADQGQFHFMIDFAKPHPAPNHTLIDRQWQARGLYLPGINMDVRQTDRFISRLGFDGFVKNGYVSVGVFGLYPSVLAWIIVWFIRPRRQYGVGLCKHCGYDLRATPQQCPECGRLPTEAQ